MVITMNSVSPFNLECVSLNSGAQTMHEIIAELTHMLFVNGAVNDEQAFMEDIEFREQLSMTGIGNEVAIPHAMNLSVNYTTVAVATLVTPIPWKSIDDLPVRVILLFAESTDSTLDHNQLIADSIQKISNPLSLDILKNTSDVSMALRLFE
jgi:PTS system fructose-specific IIA component